MLARATALVALIAAGDPPDARLAAAEAAAQARCSEPVLADTLAAWKREPGEKGDAAAHRRVLSALERVLLVCSRPEALLQGRVLAALDAGLKVEPSDPTTPALYLALVVWAEGQAPAQVERLLALGEAASAAQKEHGRALAVRFVQWRVVRALRTNAPDQVRAALARFQPADAFERLPRLDVSELGQPVLPSGPGQSVAEFIAQTNLRLMAAESMLPPGTPEPD